MTETQALYQKLMEECMEVAQAASKCSRFGPKNKKSPTHFTNEQNLIDELHDLEAVLILLMRKGEIFSGLEPSKSIDDKILRIKEYIEKSKDLGFIK